VTGLKGASSVRCSSAPAPYRLQEEENRKRPTPASFARSATFTVASRLIWKVSWGSRFPRASLERAARKITAS
jgi:hypothetical protein